jgi:hypothetical protein
MCVCVRQRERESLMYKPLEYGLHGNYSNLDSTESADKALFMSLSNLVPELVLNLQTVTALSTTVTALSTNCYCSQYKLLLLSVQTVTSLHTHTTSNRHTSHPTDTPHPTDTLYPTDIHHIQHTHYIQQTHHIQQTHTTSNRHVIHHRSEFCKLRKRIGQPAAVVTHNKLHISRHLQLQLSYEYCNILHLPCIKTSFKVGSGLAAHERST